MCPVRESNSVTDMYDFVRVRVKVDEEGCLANPESRGSPVPYMAVGSQAPCGEGQG